MRLYEYEGKQLLKKYKIPIPDHLIAKDDEDFAKVVFPVLLKAQVLVGGRGKAGGILEARTIEEGIEKFRRMKGMYIYNHKVEKIMIERKLNVKEEYYLSVYIDRREHKPVLMGGKGGVDVETMPEKIYKEYIEPGFRLEPYKAREFARVSTGLKGETLQKCGDIVKSIYDIFLDYECKLVEINPLALTDDGLFAIDAKIDLDEDAMFRHPELKAMGIEKRHELGELTEREKIAKNAGIPYVDLDGDIGVFPGGAGFGIAAIDLINHYGGKPANFMDSGGRPTHENMKLMLSLLVDNPKVIAIFGARFGGISRCDEWAEAVIQYIKENKPEKPMIMRMTGNMEEEGRKLFEKARIENKELFRKIKIYPYSTPIEDVIKETIRVVNEIKEGKDPFSDER
ncbi:MAG: succinate--CoA ligase subunit beta [Candidatus Thermoplasmatota archaeon]